MLPNAVMFRPVRAVIHLPSLALLRVLLEYDRKLAINSVAGVIVSPACPSLRSCYMLYEYAHMEGELTVERQIQLHADAFDVPR